MRIITTLLAATLTLTGPLAAQSGQSDSPQGYGAWFGSIPDLADLGGGILLEGTTPGSPAAKAGLRKGDLITMMAGDTVRSLLDMVTVLRLHQPGDTIDVVYRREGKAEKAKVVLAVRPGA
jgi:S1-C subfamily serine protease